MAMKHAEAFKIMCYKCENCHRSEFIWNSRDGVTPFCVGCRECNGMANHVTWPRDIFAPDHKPRPGDRYFRDGLPEEAASIMRRRIIGSIWRQQVNNVWNPISEKEAQELVDKAVASTRGESQDQFSEFRKGWPMLVTAGTDQG